MLVKSKISPEIQIEHVDGPERFVVSRAGMSYSVLPSGGGVTGGDLDAVAMCPAPTETSAGSTVRLCIVHDEYAASQNAGRISSSKMVAKLEALDSEGEHVAYFDIDGYGSSSAVVPANDCTPAFFGVFEDITDEFVSQATEDQVQARIDMGKVYQLLCVDADPARYWGSPDTPGIVFVGSAAPALDAFNSRERVGLLMEAGFATRQQFEGTCFVRHRQTKEASLLLLASPVVELSRPNREALDYYRLHSDEEVQDETYREMISEAASELKSKPLPVIDMSMDITSSGPRL